MTTKMTPLNQPQPRPQPKAHVPSHISLPGYTPYVVEERTGRWIASDGLERRGKTTFAFMAPGPIAVLSNDTGTKAIANKFAGHKQILWCPFEVNDDKSVSQSYHLAQWEGFKKNFNNAVKSRQVRTIIVDTATAAWELIRLARFGKLTQVMPQHYVTVNAEFQGMFEEAYHARPDLNVIFPHRVKKEYKGSKKDPDKDSWTGKFERAGYKDIRYVVDVNIRHDYDFQTKEFTIEIVDSRYNFQNAVGVVLRSGTTDQDTGETTPDEVDWDVLVSWTQE